MMRKRGINIGFKALKIILLIISILVLIVVIRTMIGLDSSKNETSSLKEIHIPHKYFKKAYTKAKMNIYPLQSFSLT